MQGKLEEVVVANLVDEQRRVQVGEAVDCWLCFTTVSRCTMGPGR
jgi:hypothetical protein